MTDNATPKRRPNYSRPTKYPARLSTMLSKNARDAIDDLVEQRDVTLGDVARSIIDDGLVLNAALDVERDAGIRPLAEDGGASHRQRHVTTRSGPIISKRASSFGCEST